jgi:hypothetical protein
MHETANGFVRVFAKTRDIPGNSEVRNLLTAQEQATPGNPVKYFEVLAGAISWGFKSPSPHQILKDLAITGWTLFS